MRARGEGPLPHRHLCGRRPLACWACRHPVCGADRWPRYTGGNPGQDQLMRAWQCPRKATGPVPSAATESSSVVWGQHAWCQPSGAPSNWECVRQENKAARLAAVLTVILGGSSRPPSLAEEKLDPPQLQGERGPENNGNLPPTQAHPHLAVGIKLRPA